MPSQVCLCGTCARGGRMGSYVSQEEKKAVLSSHLQNTETLGSGCFEGLCYGGVLT